MLPALLSLALPSITFSSLFVFRVLMCSALLFSLIPFSLANTTAEEIKRPRIGLVLGGGGAKGIAHVGVLKVLEEMRVPIDCIAGTSMGALVGASYAGGLSASELEEKLLAFNWSETIGGEGSRKLMPINRKLSKINYQDATEFGYKNGEILTPNALINSQNIEDKIRDLVSDVSFRRDISELPIPFSAVATDMISGEIVVLDKGPAALAMRASMSVPGAFAPVKVGGKLLADGGLIRNLPVDIAHKSCADIVIAVWFKYPEPSMEELQSAVSMASHSLDVMMNANQRLQINTLTDADTKIEIDMGLIGSMDFDQTEKAIKKGYLAASTHLDSIKKLSVDEQEYNRWRKKLYHPQQQLAKISEVQIKGLKRVDEEYINTFLKYSVPGATVTKENIIADSQRIFASGNFESLSYDIYGPAEKRVLEFYPKEKSWGPDFIYFDAGATLDDAGNLQAVVRADHVRTWLNDYGGEWHNSVQFGRRAFGRSEIYQPLDSRQRYFIKPRVHIERELNDLYIDGDRVARVLLDEYYVQLDAGVNLMETSQLKLGLRNGEVRTRVDTGPPIKEESSDTESNVHLNFVYDTRDTVVMPTSGSYFDVNYIYSDKWWSSEFKYELVEAVFAKTFAWKKDHINLLVAGGSELTGDLPDVMEFSLGGIRSFPGLRVGELRGKNYWLGSSSYNWQLTNIQPLFGHSIFAGLRVHSAYMGERLDGVDSEVLNGVSGSLNGKTPVGAFNFSLSYVDNDSWLLQFTIGRPIEEGLILDDMY